MAHNLQPLTQLLAANRVPVFDIGHEGLDQVLKQ
jgi:hypothetical protein